MQRLLAIMLAFASGPETTPNPAVTLFYGSDLQKLCGADRKSAEYAMCFSFVGAVLEMVNNNSIYALKFCVPPLVNVQTAVDITIKWVRDHSDRDIKGASLVVTEALADAYPCKGSH